MSIYTRTESAPVRHKTVIGIHTESPLFTPKALAKLTVDAPICATQIGEVSPREKAESVSGRPVLAVSKLGPVTRPSSHSPKEPQQHLHEPGVVCPACDAMREASMNSAADFENLLFHEAAKVWIEDEAIYHNSKETIRSYQDYITRLNTFFAVLPLKEIHIGHIREYQRIMRQKYHERSVNHDIILLAQLLKRGGLWAALEDHYKPLPLPRWQPPKVLSEREKEAFFGLASSNADWRLSYWIATLTSNTSASGKELRLLQRIHVEMNTDPPTFVVPRGKNEYRERRIPMNDHAALIMQQVLARADSIGATKPEHYIFPWRSKHGPHDPTRPASKGWLAKSWKMLVDAAIEQRIISFRVKPHNFRHQIITELLENGQPEEVVRAIAGHVSRKMMEHYSHARVEAKMSALNSLRKGPNSARIIARRAGA